MKAKAKVNVTLKGLSPGTYKVMRIEIFFLYLLFFLGAGIAIGWRI